MAAVLLGWGVSYSWGLIGPPTKVETLHTAHLEHLEKSEDVHTAQLDHILSLLQDREKHPQELNKSVNSEGLEQKYLLGYALFYSDGRKTLYYGRKTGSGMTFDPSSVNVVSFNKNQLCLNVVFDFPNIHGMQFNNTCFNTNGPVIRLFDIGGVLILIEPLVGSSDGAAWVIGMTSPVKPQPSGKG